MLFEAFILLVILPLFFLTLLLFGAFVIVPFAFIFASWYMRIYERKKQRRLRDGPNVAFFHPYCNSGGGGERVLWVAVKALLESSYPYFTLLLQSLGSMVLGMEAFMKFNPDVFIDTTGHAFTYPIFRYLAQCPVGTYTHYPVVTAAMMRRVKQRIVAHNNSGLVARNPVLTWCKLLYYKVFGWVTDLKQLRSLVKDTDPIRILSIKLVLVGACRNAEDEERVQNLKDLAKHLSIEDSVQFVICDKIETKEVFIDTCSILTSHLREYGKAVKRHEKSPSTPIETLYKKTHPVSDEKNKLGSAEHCTNILRIILKELVPWELWDTPHSELLVRILSKKLDSFIDSTLADPVWLNDKLLSIILNEKESNVEDAPKVETEVVEKEKEEKSETTIESALSTLVTNTTAPILQRDINEEITKPQSVANGEIIESIEEATHATDAHAPLEAESPPKGSPVKKEHSPKPAELLKDFQSTVHSAKTKIGGLQVPPRSLAPNDKSPSHAKDKSERNSPPEGAGGMSRSKPLPIETREPPRPVPSLPAAPESPEPEYEEPVDLSASIAKLRDLLQQTSRSPERYGWIE
ncbi:hypothetical protein MSG28_009060 [Choristoneura fumiferana]|uniref:Uncharacterized protein n=1 Tax=Choristoneura fumiferana TaxID=7141 RepID=A0ACC0KX07_CHOFU|nr:hypothetical protein MSG28_009060 [Choristoneura fumiferana]